ncbi:MAG: hypothetical protein JWM82_4441 [Myxococcales bacterium]|nr:hypothetical protein [Myxococcales bacterium]
MLKRDLLSSLVVGTVLAAAMAVGCDSGSAKKADGGAGTGGHAAGTTGTAGGSAGTTGVAGDTGSGGGGTGVAGSGGVGVAGAGGGAAGAAGSTAGTGGGAAGVGAAGAAGAPPPPTPTATTAVLELDDVIVSLKPGVDGGVDAATDAAVVDAGDAGAVDGGDAGTVSQAVSYKFDTTIQGWHYTSYGSTPPGPPSADNYASTSTLAWNAADDADGVTTSGTLKGTVPFKFEGDQIDFQAFSNGAGMYDWTGYVINAKVKLVSGGNLKNGCLMYAVLYVSDNNNYMTRLSGQVNLELGKWESVAFDMADVSAMINVAGISQMGMQIFTGPACTATPLPDGGTDAHADGAADGGADAPVDHAATDAGVDVAADVATGQ